jgi:Putative lactococcus lactis phage r1t holin
MSVHSLFSRKFWIAAAERAIRSFAASLASLLTASGTGLLDTSWSEKFSVAGMATLVTILLAIGGGTFGKGDGPSFIGGEKLPADTPADVGRPVPPPGVAAAAVPAPAAAPEVERLPDRPAV